MIALVVIKLNLLLASGVLLLFNLDVMVEGILYALLQSPLLCILSEHRRYSKQKGGYDIK